jgi:hypothetical protein
MRILSASYRGWCQFARQICDLALPTGSLTPYVDGQRPKAAIGGFGQEKALLRRHKHTFIAPTPPDVR